MLSYLAPFLSATVILVLFVVGAFAQTFPPSSVHSSSERAYIYCSAGDLGWEPFENGRAVCRQWPLVVSPGAPTLLILCYEGVAIGLTRTPGNSSSIDSLGLTPRTGNVTLPITNPVQLNYTFESRCENPAPAETTAQKNAWRLPNNLNPRGGVESGPCCVIEFNVPTTYIGDLYYQSITGDLFYGPMIIEANVTSTTTTPPTNSTTTDSGTTTTTTTTTSTTTTTPPVPTSTPLPPNNTTTDVPTSTSTPTPTPTPTPTMSSTPTPTMVTNTTSPPTTINPPNDGANFASVSLAAYSCTVLTMLIGILPSYFSVL